MSADNIYLAVFVGSKSGARRTAWDALSEGERAAKQQEGITAWGAWLAKNHGAIVEIGGPLGKTKQVTANGVADASNELGAFTVVRAASHDAAARLFENHPHFTIFPGDAVEVMPILALPGSSPR